MRICDKPGTKRVPWTVITVPPIVGPPGGETLVMSGPNATWICSVALAE